MSKKVAKKIGIAIGVLLCIFCALVLFIAKIEELSSFIINKKNAILMDTTPKTEVDFSVYEPFEEDPDAWYAGAGMIAHACGGIDGKTYSNSREALDLALENGFRLVETDFLLTSDGRVVLRHEWGQDLEQGSAFAEGVPDYETFMNTLIYRKYHALSFTDLLDYMERYPSLYIITDTKLAGKEMLRLFEAIVQEAKDRDAEQLLERLVIQLYAEKDLEQIRAIYPFRNWLFTVYRLTGGDVNTVARFCLQNRIPVVTMPTGWITSEDYLNDYQAMNIKVYTHTPNYVSQYETFQNRGVFGIYTDFLVPEDTQLLSRE